MLVWYVGRPAVLIDPSPLSPHMKNDVVFHNVPEDLPFVDMSVPNNIVAWFAARQVALTVGMC